MDLVRTLLRVAQFNCASNAIPLQESAIKNAERHHSYKHHRHGHHHDLRLRLLDRLWGHHRHQRGILFKGVHEPTFPLELLLLGYLHESRVCQIQKGKRTHQRSQKLLLQQID